MTPVQEYLNKKTKSGKELNLDTFGEIIDEFLDANDVQMLITIPKGTNRPKVQDNIGIGPVGAFYFILKCITPIANDMFYLFDDKGGEAFEKEKLADALCELVKNEIMEA